MGAILSLTLLSLIGIVSPGPDFVAVSQACLLSEKNKKPLNFIGGIATGNGVWVFAALVGIDRLFHIYPQSLSTLKLIGGGYLLYLGLVALGFVKSGGRTVRQTLSRSNFYKGLMITLANPKAALFYLAILSSNLPETIDRTIFLLVITVGIATFIWFYFISSILFYGRIYNAYKANEKIINGFFGTLFLGYGIFQVLSVITQH